MRPMSRRHRALTAATLALGLVGTAVVATASPAASAASAPSSAVTASAVKKASGFLTPVQVTSANDGSSRLFIVEKRGAIRVWTGSQIQGPAYLGLRDRVDASAGERGLLGVAFPPGFRTSPYFWVTYTRKGDGALVVSRFQASSSAARFVYGSTEKVVLVVARPSASVTNHNGGAMSFGKDGFLYIGTGDGGGAGDPYARAQRTRYLNGKILRINVNKSCNGKSYCVPSSNPYAGSITAKNEIWAVGLRNPWRFSADPATGDLWIGDVGQGRWEEVDRIPSGAGGANLGWACKEGSEVYDASRCNGSVSYLDPVVTYCHPGSVAGCLDGDGGRSVTGGFVYRGSAYAGFLTGQYIYADFVSGIVWAFDGATVTKIGALDGITSFGVDDAQELYAVTIDGSLWRLAFAPA